MSRIGRNPITLPAGVTVEVAADNTVTVKGKNGTLSEKISPRMTVKVDGNTVTVERITDGIHVITDIINISQNAVPNNFLKSAP